MEDGKEKSQDFSVAQTKEPELLNYRIESFRQLPFFRLSRSIKSSAALAKQNKRKKREVHFLP